MKMSPVQPPASPLSAEMQSGMDRRAPCASFKKIINIFNILSRFGMSRRAGVAVIFALLSPALIAITGLSVDAGYWYQGQENLQSAADAGALAAARAAAAANVTTASAATSFAAGNGLTQAVAAANNATNNRYQFAANSMPQISLSVSTGASSSSSQTMIYWTATATMPRTSFLSRVSGEGLHGMAAGLQGASATAVSVSTTTSSASYCMRVNGQISVTGGAKILGTNCGIYTSSTACASGNAAITVSGSGQVIGATGVGVAGACVSDDGYTSTPQYSQSGYIGTDANNKNNGDISTVTTHAADPGDALAALNPNNEVLWNPGWTVPSPPTESGSPVDVSSQIGSPWNPLNTNSVQCDYGAIPQGSCVVDANADKGYLTGLGSYGLNGLTLLANTSGTPGTYITGGLSGQNNNGGALTLRDTNYYISGGMNITLSNGISIGNGSQNVSFIVNGGMSLTNSTATLAAGTYYLSGKGATLSSTSNATGYALTTNSPTVTINGSNYYVNGGVDLSGGTTSSYLTSGQYWFRAFANNSNNSSGTGAFYAEQGYDTFGTATTLASASSSGVCSATALPATYFFDGGLTISSGTKSVLLCPGIYYVRNGNLVISSGTSVVGQGVTFMLEGNAGYIFNGGATINLSAPTSNCVSPSNFPESAYDGYSPYDGTNGQGICGVVIYQSRTDTTADTVQEGAASVFTGAIYAPGAALTLSGAGSLTITTTGVPAITAASVTSTGSGNITMKEDTGSSSSGSTSTTTTSSVLLVN